MSYPSRYALGAAIVPFSLHQTANAGVIRVSESAFVAGSGLITFSGAGFFGGPVNPTYLPANYGGGAASPNCGL